MTVALDIDGLEKSYGARPLLRGASLTVHRGERVALIGENGTGKSTLLRILTREVDPDGGAASFHQDERVGFFEQVPKFDGQATVRQILELVFAPLEQMIARYGDLAASMDRRAEDLLHRIEGEGGWDWRHRVLEAAESVGLTDLDQPVSRLSGGYRRRVALARILLLRPTFLLLDEPTNHLDTETIEWMERWLVGLDATVFVVTHDRYFLDRVATAIVELRAGTLRRYEGNYAAYLEQRAEEEATATIVQKRRAALFKVELAWSKKTPLAMRKKSEARITRLEDLRAEVASDSRRTVRPDFELATANTKVGLVLEVEDVAFAHGDGPTLVKDLSFGLVRGDRLGVVGPNGTGKSTLLRLLEGSLTPTAGRIRRGGQIRIAHFDQERAGLVESETVRGTLLPQGGEYVTFGGAPLHVIAWMQRFGFEAEAQDRLVRSLSGGERNRLALAAFLLTDANLLLLDEPTNDLDLFTIAVLEEALLDYNGTVITVSHDRYFLDRVATAIVGFGSETDGRTTFAKGGFADYQTLVEQRRADREARARSSAPRATAKAPAPDLAKKLTYAERRELTELPERLEGLESRLRAEQARLEDPGLWQGDPSRAIALRKTISVLEAEVAAAYARWQDLDARA